MASFSSLCYHIAPIILSIFFFIVVASASSSTTTKSRIHNGGFTKIFAFGDSFTDTGNTRSQTGPNGFLHVSNFPYGSTFFNHPTNRYSNGRLTIDFIMEYLSLPYLPPYMNRTADTSHGVNFAVGGSTAISHAFFVRNNLTLDKTPQSLQTQLAWFKKYLGDHGCQRTTSPKTKCKALVENALFWVGEIGVNDNAYTVGATVSQTLIRRLTITSVTRFLQALLSMGAKYIVVQGMPPTGCLPLALTLASTDDRDDMGCVSSSNKQTYTYNFILQAKLLELKRQYPHAVISYLDYWHAYKTVMKNLARYKFKEPFKTCCGTGGGPYNYDIFATCGSETVPRSCPNPSQFINWDGVHLTEAMYKVVTDMFLHGGYSHPPLGLLLSSRRQGLST